LEKYERYLAKISLLNIDSPIKFKVTENNEIVIADVDNLAK